jgi:hypothetical protein
MEASLHPDGGYYALKDGEAPAQSMRSKKLRHVVPLKPLRAEHYTVAYGGISYGA